MNLSKDLFKNIREHHIALPNRICLHMLPSTTFKNCIIHYDLPSFWDGKRFCWLEYFDIDSIAWIDTMLVLSVSTYQVSLVDQEFPEQASLPTAYCFFFF